MPDHTASERAKKDTRTQDEMHREFMRKRRMSREGGRAAKKGKSPVGSAVEAAKMAMPGGAGIIGKATKKIKDAFD